MTFYLWTVLLWTFCSKSFDENHVCPGVGLLGHRLCIYSPLLSSVQSLSHVQLFATSWIAAHQASLSITNSRSSLRLMSFESVMLSSQLILNRSFLPLSSIFPSIRVFYNELALHIRWPSFGASASVFPMSVQGWFPLGWTGLIALLSKGLSKIFSSTTVQKYQFFGAQPSLWSNSHIHIWLSENHSFDYRDICRQNDVSAF